MQFRRFGTLPGFGTALQNSEMRKFQRLPMLKFVRRFRKCELARFTFKHEMNQIPPASLCQRHNRGILGLAYDLQITTHIIVWLDVRAGLPMRQGEAAALGNRSQRGTICSSHPPCSSHHQQRSWDWFPARLHEISWNTWNLMRFWCDLTRHRCRHNWGFSRAWWQHSGGQHDTTFPFHFRHQNGMCWPCKMLTVCTRHQDVLDVWWEQDGERRYLHLFRPPVMWPRDQSSKLGSMLTCRLSWQWSLPEALRQSSE